MPLQLRDNAGAARAHETVRIRSRRSRRRCNNNRHCVYAVEDNQDGPPNSNDEHEARAEHALNADPPDNPGHNVPTTDGNLKLAESPLHITQRAGARAHEQTTVTNTPGDPNLQRRLDQLARTPREPTQHRHVTHDRAELQRKEIADALKTLLERARTTERNTDHNIDAVRTAKRNVEAVQERARDNHKLVLELSKQGRDIDRQLEDLTRIVENTRSELGNLIDYVGAGPDRMEHDFSIDMLGIPNAEASTIRPSSLRTLIERINMTTGQVFSRLSVWNDNVFNPVNAFGLNAVLTILRTLTEYMIAYLNEAAYGGLTLARTDLTTALRYFVLFMRHEGPFQPPPLSAGDARAQTTGSAAAQDVETGNTTLPTTGQPATAVTVAGATNQPATNTTVASVTNQPTAGPAAPSVNSRPMAAAPAPSALRTSRRVDFQPYIDTHAPPATQASTETVPGIPVYNRLFAERLRDFSAPLTPTNVTLECIEPPTAHNATTNTIADPVRMPGSNPPPDTPKGSNMVVVVPQPLTQDEHVSVSTFVLNHGPIAVVDLLLERARKTRNMLRTHHLPADATSAALLNQAEQCVLHCKRALALTTTLDPAHEAILSNLVSDTKIQRAAETLERNILPELRNEIRDRTRNIRDTAKHRATN
jgi:hypothetical protein